jgi:ribosomal protein S18 acetylase RimI-like enzyme
MSIIVRPVTDKDLPAIFLLIKEFAVFQRTPEKLTVSLDQMQSEKDYFNAFVAEDAGEGIVGFASYYFAYYSWTGKAIYLDDLYVKESSRGQSIGSQLLDALIALAQKNKFKKIRWQVSKWNEKAIRFYKKLGAVTDDTEMNCDLLIQG